MNFNILLLNFRNHKWKYLAILFASMATILMGTSFIISFYSYYFSSGVGSWLFTWLWDFVIYLVCYLLLLVGNIKNNNYAYQGMLGFVFFMVFNLILPVLSTLLNIATGAWTSMLGLMVVAFGLVYVAQAVFGILAYILTYKYLRGTYYRLRRIVLFAILYALFLFIGYFATLGIYAIEDTVVTLTLDEILLEISNVLFSVAIIFTVLRLRRY
jgi:hypothetical protein